VDAPGEFVWRLTREVLAQDKLRSLLQKTRNLPRAIGGWVKDNFDEAEFEGAKVKFKESLPEDWHSSARRLLVELEKAEPTLIFIFDELPSMLGKVSAKHGDGEARNFLAWFRTVRLLRKGRLRRHRFIVGGSTGIDLIVRHLRAADAINDFERLAVEPLCDSEARRLIQDLAESLDMELPDDLVSGVLGLIGPPVPYFIHMLFSQLAQLPSDRRRPLTGAALEEVYRQRVLGPTCRRYFEYYRSRLARHGKALEAAAIAVLRTVAERGRVSDSALYEVCRKARKRGAKEVEFADLMADLECDWYLVLDVHTNEYYFLLNVMRDWWHRWYRALKPSQAAGEGQ